MTPHRTYSTLHTEEVATILLVINLKLTNDTTTANNKLVRDYKVRGISLVLQYVSMDSQNVMDTWVKQNQGHWYFTIKKYSHFLVVKLSK